MGIRDKTRVVVPVGESQDPQGFWQRMLAYLAWKEAQHSGAHNIRNREHHLTRFFIWCDERGLMRPEEVTLAVLERYQRHLYLMRKKNGEPLGITTQCNHLCTLKAFFSWLTKRHFIQSNPAADMALPRIGERLPKDVLSETEIEQLLGYPDLGTPHGLRDRAMLEVLYSTGIRRAELASLTLHSINHEQGTLMIRQGKGRKDRLIPIGERACYWVRRYQESARPRLAVVPDEITLFLAKDGLGFAVNGLSRHIGGLIQGSGVRDKGSCHLLRHSMATLMLENGADTRWIQKILGHADLTSTQIYTRVSIQALKAVHTATHPGAVQKSEARNQGSGVSVNSMELEPEGTELLEGLPKLRRQKPDAG